MRALALFAATLLSTSTVLAADTAKPTVLITGANRGIGLELVRQFSARDWKIIATARDAAGATDLQALAKADPDIVIEQLDVTDHPG
ncbi:MAG: SDR family NAD(P)-dependent oxidoreductase, partial [Gammaproteobacteria bacterium]